VGEFFQSLQKTWQGLSAPQRVGTLLALLAGAGVIAGIAYFGNRTEYRPLAGGDNAKLGEIATALESAGIQPKIVGNAVQVPVEQFDRAYLAVASLGLNTEGVGFELLDKGTSAFTTSLLERVNVQRATAGEIERILRGYPGISRARVMISQDRESWKTNDKDGTASVSLTLKPGAQIGATDVAAIQACVANSWHTLRPESVAVIANGKKLTRESGENDKTFAASNHQLMSQMEYEEGLRKRAQEALDRAQGPGKTYVTVSASLNFDQIVEKSRSGGDPEKRTPKKVESKETSRQNGDATGGGAVGVAGNVAPDSNNNDSARAEPRETSNETTTSTTTEYFESFVDMVHEKRGFDVSRLSVALFVDRSLKDRLPELEKTVKASVGFDEKRKDQFSATAESDFAKPADDVKPAEPVSSSNLPELISTGGRIAALLGLTILFIVILRRAGKSDVLIPAAPNARARAIRAGVPANLTAVGAALPDEPVEAERSPEEIARANLLKNATAAAVADPAAAGRVVRGWLEEKRNR
jgi:flagellar M-ring protein FliF